MKIKYQALLLPALMAALAGCSHDELDIEEKVKTGTVSQPGIEVVNASEVVNSTVQSRAVADVSNYIVDFYRTGEESAFRTYVYADMPGTVELPEGAYYVKVRSHNLQKAEYDRPYFCGQSADFTITAGKLTTIDPVKCTFGSLKVSIIFGERLQQAMGNDVKVTVVVNDEGKLEFTPGRNTGYFATIDGSTTLVATFSGTVNGLYENFYTTYTDVAAGQHRIITYEAANLPDVPSGYLTGSGLKINVSYEDVNLTGSVDPGKETVLPAEDEPGNPAGGESGGGDVSPVSGSAISFGGTLADGQTYTSTELDVYNVTIASEHGCKDIRVNIDSTSLDADELHNVGLAPTFSLANDSQFFNGLTDLGLPCGNGVIDQHEVNFDITAFMSLLGILGQSRSVFSLEVTDVQGNVSSISFTIVVE